MNEYYGWRNWETWKVNKYNLFDDPKLFDSSMSVNDISRAMEEIITEEMNIDEMMPLAQSLLEMIMSEIDFIQFN